MKKNKYLPYVIFGVPILLGGYLLYKYATKPKLKDTPITPQEPSTLSTPSTPSTNYSQKNTLPLKKGNKGGYVVAIQKKLGISADGIFGSGTATSVANFQVSKGLSPDGIVGVKTWKALFGADFPNTKTSIGVLAPIETPTTIDNILNPYGGSLI
jgi:peptidoglycan hydrolase-like protein with peptidoglycan-binding domain